MKFINALRVMQFNGQTAGQTVFHYHLYLRPAYAGQCKHSHGSDLADRDHTKDLAIKIRAQLGT